MSVCSGCQKAQLVFKPISGAPYASKRKARSPLGTHPYLISLPTGCCVYLSEKVSFSIAFLSGPFTVLFGLFCFHLTLFFRGEGRAEEEAGRERTREQERARTGKSTQGEKQTPP